MFSQLTEEKLRAVLNAGERLLDELTALAQLARKRLEQEFAAEDASRAPGYTGGPGKPRVR